MFNKTQLSPVEAFYSKLIDEDILTKKDYQYVIKTFKDFNCNILGDYQDLYLQIDVLLLSEVFEIRDPVHSSY